MGDPVSKNGSVIPAYDAYRAARMKFLAEHPMNTADRIGMYAFLFHEKMPRYSCCLYLLDRKLHLTGTEILYKGRRLTAERYAPDALDILRRTQPYSFFFSVSVEDPMNVDSREDEFDLTRAVLYCEQFGFHPCEAVLVLPDSYDPLFRRYRNAP